MVGVGKGFASLIKGLVKGHSLVGQLQYQLGDGHGGVAIVKLHGKAAAEGLILAAAQHIGDGGAAEEIFLP